VIKQHEPIKKRYLKFILFNFITFCSLKVRFIISNHYSISALNETALLVSFENVIDETINEKVIALHNAFAADFFPGFIETVPAYSSLAVFYDPFTIKKYHREGTAFDLVKKHAEQLLSSLQITTPQQETEIISVPVHYNGEDLEEVAMLHGISMEELVKIHSQRPYRVFMIGFLPGFAYMGKLDERIATPRKKSPRQQVSAGSVGIAGYQTGIYPFTSPGGWQLIGQTPLKIFDKAMTDPCLFKAGDSIQFISISKEEFEKQNEY